MTAAETYTFWRELTTEPNTTIWPDATVLVNFLRPAMSETNRRIRYYLKDSTSIDVLTSTQEYDLPSDFVETVWLELGTAMLDNLDQLRTRTDQSTWRQQAASTPTSFYTYGLMLGLVPKPNAAAAALTLTLRYVATPTWDATNGFEKLATDHHHIPVYRAAQLYFEAHGYDQHFARAARFQAIWETECERVREFYAHRLQERGAR